MKIFLKKTVLEAAMERISRLFDEFQNVIVGFSGGKDSTVVLNLALQVAKEKNRLPLKVLFLDQEAEWQCVRDYTREVMDRPDVTPYWMQIPMQIANATSAAEPWLWCWEVGKESEWMREKEPDSLKENVYGSTRFAELFEKIVGHHWPDQPTAYLAGVRCEESPSRMSGLTNAATYKDITWGKMLNRKFDHYTFYPLYDWSYQDVWKAIHDGGWPYCRVYDMQYQYGVGLASMRVSSLHHETAVHSLFYMQEFERETYNKLTARLAGVSTAAHAGKDDFFGVKELPWMFEDWKEYRDYLLPRLIGNEAGLKLMEERFAHDDEVYKEFPRPEVV